MTSSLRGPARSELNGTLNDNVTAAWGGGADELKGAFDVRLKGGWACRSFEFDRWPPKGIEGARVIRSHPLRAEFAMPETVFMLMRC